jgi:hypothetical protein
MKKITNAAAVAEATRSLNPLSDGPMRCIGIVYHEATGELAATPPLPLDEALHQRDLPVGDILVFNAFSPLDEADIVDGARRAVEIYKKREAQK